MAGGNIGNALQVRLKGDILSFPVKIATAIYRGAPVAADSTGYAVMASDEAAMKFLGIAEESNTVAEAVASGTVSVKVRRRGIFRMKLTGVDITHIGLRAYAETAQGASTDYAVALAASSAYKNLIGTIVKLDATDNYCWVDIAPEYGVDMDVTAHEALHSGDAHVISAIAGEAYTLAGTDPSITFAMALKRAVVLSDNTPNVVTLPTAAAMDALGDGLTFRVVKGGTGVDAVTFTPGAGSVIAGDGVINNSTLVRTMAPGDSITFTYTKTTPATTYTVVAETHAPYGVKVTETGTISLAQMRAGGVIEVANGAAATLDLATPTGVFDLYRRVSFVKTAGNSFAITLTTAGAETIDGAANDGADMDALYDSKTLTWMGATVGWVTTSKNIH